MKTIILLIILWFSLMPLKNNAQILTDTLWAVPTLDGDIAYYPAIGYYSLSTQATYFMPGDGWDGLLSKEVFVRAYLSFDLSALNYADSLEIDQAFVGIYQYECAGNNQQGVYPIWDVAGGDTHFCVLDHINYGGSLDFGDWTAGDPGDPQTQQTNIGNISADSFLEYKTLEVTPWLKQDITDSLLYNQYRLRFTIDTDNDTLNDWILFISGDAPFAPKPFLSIIYKDVNTIIENHISSSSFKMYQNYPNPFNNQTRIDFFIEQSNFITLIMYDINGKTVKKIFEGYKNRGFHSYIINAQNLSSGLYFYCLQTKNQSITKKMIYMR